MLFGTELVFHFYSNIVIWHGLRSIITLAHFHEWKEYDFYSIDFKVQIGIQMQWLLCFTRSQLKRFQNDISISWHRYKSAFRFVEDLDKRIRKVFLLFIRHLGCLVALILPFTNFYKYPCVQVLLNIHFLHKISISKSVFPW